MERRRAALVTSLAAGAVLALAALALLPAYAALPAPPLRVRGHFVVEGRQGADRQKFKLTIDRWSRPEDLRFLADVAHSSDTRRLWNEMRKLDDGGLQIDTGMRLAVMVATLEETKFGTVIRVVGESPSPSPAAVHPYFALELHLDEAGTAASGTFLRTARVLFENGGAVVTEGAVDPYGPAEVEADTIEPVTKR